MRSIQARFLKVKERNPNLGDYLVFAQAVKNQRFSPDIIARWFNKLIPKKDYDKKDKKSLINQLVDLSKR